MRIRIWLTIATLAMPFVSAADEEFASRDCTATASMDYYQANTEAAVDVSVDHDYCPASEGTFVLEVTVRKDGAEETEKLKFPETWSRDDDKPVLLTRRYPIGDNVDLLRIRIRKLSCSCIGQSD